MKKSELKDGLVHILAPDTVETLTKNKVVPALWNDLTPVARNEFLCWIDNAKQQKTREKRKQRMIEELLEGQKRPCCWAGCIHRTDKKPSRSQRFIYRLDKNTNQLK